MTAAQDAGTILTFLLTDIEGSTRMWEQDAERTSHAVARHDALVHGAVEKHGGCVVKTTGDGIYAVFPDALDSVQAVVDFQVTLADPAATAGLVLPVRCGLHAGPAMARGNDYFGPTVNRTARIMGVAHGGQVLLSRAVADLVRKRLPEGVSLRDLGSVRLRDLSSPERISQLLHPGLRQDFPALRSLEATPNNLPEQLTSFIGREREVAEGSTLLARTRLLTLLGMGGLGKTRLSLQIAADSLDANPDGVWFVDLAPIRDPSVVANVVAQVLGIREETGKSLAQTLCDHLKPRELLLILDNCEHLIGACADVASALLRAVPGVRILATSREALGIPGEQIYPLSPLAPPDRTASVDVLSRSAAVQLFMDRSQLQKPGFVLNENHAPLVAELCARLEGIPLAVELAAARMRSLSLRDINERLHDRFKLLTGGGRTLMGRQRTLRALIDWSYELLQPAEQALLCRLSVFAGGCTPEAAARVCGGEDGDEWPVLDLLTALSDKSLLIAHERDGGTRYRMLETVREYARERLHEHGSATHWHRRHLAYFLALAEQAEPELMLADQKAWFERLEVEHDNLRAALARAGDPGGHAESGLRMAAALWRFWSVRGYLGEGRRTLHSLLATTSPTRPADATTAKALYGAAIMAWQQGDYAEARALHEHALALRRDLGDRQGVAASLNALGNVIKDSGDYGAARALYGESLTIFRELGDERGVATLQSNLGIVARDQGDLESARKLFEAGLALSRKRGDRHGVAIGLKNLGGVAFDEHDLASAHRLYDESQKVFRELGDKQGLAGALNHLGAVKCSLGDVAEARRLFVEGLATHDEMGDRWGIAVSLEGLAAVASLARRPLHGALLWGAAQRLRTWDPLESTCRHASLSIL